MPPLYLQSRHWPVRFLTLYVFQDRLFVSFRKPLRAFIYITARQHS